MPPEGRGNECFITTWADRTSPVRSTPVSDRLYRDSTVLSCRQKTPHVSFYFIFIIVAGLWKTLSQPVGSWTIVQIYIKNIKAQWLSKSLWKCRGRAVKSTEFKRWCFWSAECGFESPAATLVSLSKTLDHCFVLWMGRNAIGPMCCVTHVKEPSALIEKRRGSPWCSWFDWLHIVT